MIRHIPPRRRAFTLIEILYSLMLLGIAGLIAARLFGSSMRVIASAPLGRDQRACVDRMSDVLRHDAWGATTIGEPDQQSIDLKQPDGAIIRWRFRTDEVTRTSPGGDVDHWNPKLAIRPRVSGGTVVLISPEAPLEQLRFISQVIDAEGSR